MICNDANMLEYLGSMRKRWSHDRLSLLFSHLIYALDETIDLSPLDEKVDMLEAELMLSEIITDLKKLFPDRFELYRRASKESIKNNGNFEDSEEESDLEPIID